MPWGSKQRQNKDPSASLDYATYGVMVAGGQGVRGSESYQKQRGVAAEAALIVGNQGQGRAPSAKMSKMRNKNMTSRQPQEQETVKYGRKRSKVNALTIRLKNAKVLEHCFCVVPTEQYVGQSGSF